MDLQWQRQAEFWLKLMGASGHQAALSIPLTQGLNTFYLEQSLNRARVSLSRPLRQPDQEAVLLRLLSLLQPDAGDGIPLRAWLSDKMIWLSTMAPPDSGAELWVDLARRQRLLLDRVVGGGR